MPPTERSARPHLLPGHAAAPAGQTPLCPRPLRLCPLRRRHRRLWRRSATGTPTRLPWSDGVLADLERGRSADPVCLAVIDTIRRWDIPLSHFRDFLDSMRMDLTVTEYATFEDLTRYTWGSAAVIGLEMMPILGRAHENIPWPALRPHAIDLGVAFQLTNFIRDVAEDLGLRAHLPSAGFTARLRRRPRTAGARDAHGASRRPDPRAAGPRDRARPWALPVGGTGHRPRRRNVAGLSAHCFRALRRDPRRGRAGRVQRVLRPDLGPLAPSTARCRTRHGQCLVDPDETSDDRRACARRPSHTHVDRVSSTRANPNSRSSTGA